MSPNGHYDPAVARRLNAGYWAELVAEHRMDEAEAGESAADLALNLACRSVRVEA